MPADELQDLANSIYDVWKSDPAHCDFTLALHKWAPGTLESWVRHLQRLAKFAVRYCGIPKDKVMVAHFRHFAEEGKKLATLCGAISTVRLCEKLRFLAPTMSLHPEDGNTLGASRAICPRPHRGTSRSINAWCTSQTGLIIY